MNSEPSYQMHRASKYLVACLAALVAVSAPSLRAATSDDVQRLQDENAALRKRNAELENQAAQPAATTTRTQTTTTTQPAPGALVTDEGVEVLSPFQVVSDKDYGYLKTNAATATKIGMEIQRVPLNISVISREFIDDTNAKSLMDLFRYSAASAGDNRYQMRVPANEATPQGTMTMRGFSVNNIMENGIFRYTAPNLDNVERVEIVQGPASVFFGQGYPGGVINYITKRAVFSKIPTTFTYQIDDNGGDKVLMDQNTVLSKKAAFRIVGAWTDTVGDRAYEYKKGFNITPSVTLIPFDSGKIRVNFDFEYLHDRFNYNDGEWIYSDFAGWKSAATLGTYGTSTATLSSTIVASAGNGLTANVVQATTTPTVAYSTYIANKRVALNDYTIPAYTSVARGAFYTNKAGQVVHDKSFDWTSRGSYDDEEVKVATAAVEFSPFDWLSGRGAWVRDQGLYNNLGNSATISPYADGVHFNVAQGAGSGYYRETKTALVDLVFKFDVLGVKSKILVGAQKADWRQNYAGIVPQTDLQLGYLPGATNTISNPDYFLTNRNKYNVSGTPATGQQLNAAGTGAMVPANEVIFDRSGVIKPVRQIYNNWDPGAELNPDISVINKTWLDYLDGYRPVLSSEYINYQGQLFDDRLTILTGYREEKRYERWQDQSVIYPWYVMPNDMPQNPNNYPEDVWNNSKAYQQTIPLDQKGRSWMAGASFAITKDINVYASYSKTFKFNSGNVGGFFPGPGIGDELGAFQAALDWGQKSPTNPAGHPGSFIYNGTVVTSVAQAKALMAGLGAYDMIKNETGTNAEIGAKISTQDDKIVGTISIFRGERSNQKVDDGPRQAADPWNGVNNNQSANSYFDPNDSLHYQKTIFRWRSTDVTNRIEGSEAEVIWTPIRNFQAVINGSWLWTAKALSALNVPAPGTARYLAQTPAGKVASDIYYGARLENVPEYRFNFFGKYTLTEGVASGTSFGLGMRYSSKAVVSRSVDWNPLNGGFQSGDYTVFDLTASYPWEVFGYKLKSTFGVYNVLNKDYVEGATYVLSPPRNWLFSNTLSF